MLFSEIVGQNDIKQRLVSSVKENRISHAQLFLGKEGTGALALAIAYAQFIACTNKQEEDACNVCPSCVKFNKLAHPDLHFVYPVNITTKITKEPVSTDFIEDWRKAVLANPYFNLHEWLDFMGIENKQGIINANESNEIVKKLSLKAYESEYKFMIIWMAEKMNNACANKLLKILEEPPDKTLFILVGEHGEQMLPTILSRTQLIKIHSISKHAMMHVLIEKHGLEGDIADSVANLADGNYNEAQKLVAETTEENKNFTLFSEWMRVCYKRDFVKLVGIVDELAGIGRENQKNFFMYALHMVRECLIMNYGDDSLTKLNPAELGFVRKFSPFINGANVMNITEEFNKAHQHIERNANAKILLMDLSLKMFAWLRMGVPA